MSQVQTNEQRKKAISKFHYENYMKKGGVHKVQVAGTVLLTNGSVIRVSKQEELEVIKSNGKTITIGKDGFTVNLPINSRRIISIQ